MFSYKNIYSVKKSLSCLPGFTLAETLITIVIVGIIAALTVPNLIVHYQKQATVTRLKKAYSALAQAVTKSQIKNGHVSTWDFSLTSYGVYEKYLSDFIQLSQSTVGMQRSNNVNYTELNGTNNITLFYNDSKVINLADGTQLIIYNGSHNSTIGLTRKSFAVDINGYKKPNKMGKDVFVFVLTKNKGLIPHFFDDGDSSDIPMKSREQIINGPSSYSYQCAKGKRGLWCSALIMKDGWQISDDYPW